MKKILTLILCVMFLVSCSDSEKKDDQVADMKEYTQLESKDVRFLTNSPDAILKKIENDEPGVYYLGYGNCPWCQALVPVLNEVLIENDQYAYYLNVSTEEFVKRKGYSYRIQSINERLGDKASGGYLPFVIFVDKEGNLDSHLGTLADHNATKGKMSEEQIDRLKEILSSKMN